MLNKKIACTLMVAGTLAAIAPQAMGWGCSRSFSGGGRYGGSFSHSGSSSGGYGGFSHSGSTSYTSRYGHTYSGSHSGSGTYGYGGASYHGSYSGSAGYHSYSGSASYCGYHGCAYPTYSTGCYGSGFGAGLATGAIVGAAVASSAHAAAPVYVYPASGVYVQPTPVYTAPAATPAPAAGPAPVPPSPEVALPTGATVTVLPPGFATVTVKGTQYYLSGVTWYRMEYGANGVYFLVVPAP